MHYSTITVITVFINIKYHSQYLFINISLILSLFSVSIPFEVTVYVCSIYYPLFVLDLDNTFFNNFLTRRCFYKFMLFWICVSKISYIPSKAHRNLLKAEPINIFRINIGLNDCVMLSKWQTHRELSLSCSALPLCITERLNVFQLIVLVSRPATLMFWFTLTVFRKKKQIKKKTTLYSTCSISYYLVKVVQHLATKEP